MAKCDPVCLPNRPDVEQLARQIKNEMSARLFSGAPIIPGSNEDVVAYLMAGALYEAHGWVSAAFKETDPRCMCCDRLKDFAARRGIYPFPARAAKGYVRLTGTSGAAIPASLSLVGPNGETYVLDPDYDQPTALDGGGHAVIRVVCIVPGTSGNVDAGETMTLASPPPGVDSTATVLASGIVGGAEAEDCESLRARVLSRLKSGAVSANAQWLSEKLKEWPGVTRVCVNKCDCPTPYFYVFMDGTFEPHGVPPASLLQEMQDWLFGNPQGAGFGVAPVGAKGILRQAQPETIDIRVVGMEPNNSALQAEVNKGFQRVLREMVCPGGCLCIKWLDNVLVSIGGVSCYESLEVVTGDNSRIDGSDVCFECDYFPVLGTVLYV